MAIPEKIGFVAEPEKKEPQVEVKKPEKKEPQRSKK